MDDLRRSPATLTLAALWILVFAMMHWRHGSFAWGWNPFAVGGLQVVTTHQFGDATTADLASGQLWRAVTSTFVHYSLLHLLLNLFGLVQLGLLIEAWYGSALFLAIYLVIGGLGNLMAGFARPWFGILDYVHSGGGSTVVFGLIGLCTVVGYRSKSEEGRELGRLMLIFLVFNVGLGLFIPMLNGVLGMSVPSFDNLAHVAGTLVGAGIGMLHKALVRTADRPTARAAGVASALILVACMGAQTRANRVELEVEERRAIALDRWQAARATIANLLRLEALYQLAYYRGVHHEELTEPHKVLLIRGLRGNQVLPLPRPEEIHRELKAALDRLEGSADVLGTGPSSHAYRRLRDLAGQALARPPSALKVQEFEARLATILPIAERDYEASQARFLELSGRTRRP